MEKPNNNFKFLIDRISKTVWMILSVILIFGIIAATAVIYFNKDNSIGITENDKISITPTQIRSIENIGEWVLFDREVFIQGGTFNRHG